MALKHLLNWDKPRVVNPSNPCVPWIVLAVMILSTICAIASGFAGIVADSSIQGALVIGGQKNLWLTILYFFMTAFMVPIADKCCTRFGYKTVFFVGLIVFFIPNFIAGLASNYWVMLIFRCLSAVGAGAIFPASLTLVDHSFPKEKKTVAIAIYVALAFGVGTGGGTFLGGYLTDYFGWRWIYFIFLFFAPVVLILNWIFVQETERKSAGPFDFWGTVFYAGAVGSLVTWIPNVKAPWNTEGFTSTLAISTTVIFFISLIGLIWWEKRAKSPLLNLSLFGIRPFILGNTAIFVVAVTFFSMTMSLTSVFEEGLLYSKYRAALLQVPFGVSIGIFGAMSGLLSPKIGVRILAMIGMVITAISCFTMHSITIQSSHGSFIWLQVFHGAGIGFALGPLTALALKRIQPENIGQAVVIVTLFRQLGGSLGPTIMQFIQYFRYPFHLLRFGEQMQLNSPALENHLEESRIFLVENAGSIPSVGAYGQEGFTEAATFRSFDQLREYASIQAQILSINDAFWLLGWAVVVISIVIGFFMIRARIKEGRIS
ncbi:MAG: MFS transporter [Simkania sp.]|nr:MFS transporter [Simkania sp.]